MKPNLNGDRFRILDWLTTDWRIIGQDGKRFHLESASLETDIWCLSHHLTRVY